MKKLLPIPFILISITLGLNGEIQKLLNVEFAKVGDISLKLDVYLPTEIEEPTLIVWVHGGAWRRGSKENPSILPMVEKGYAVASVGYRLTPVAPFPANVHDIKAAIRYLRANAELYGFKKDGFVISGASAGGHLAALVGVSNGQTELEGDVGTHLDVSSDIAAIVDFYGASNLTTILNQSTPHGLSVRVPALELLIGGHPDDLPKIAKLASPVYHVDENDPPLLLIHGDQDPQMPINQAHELHGIYKSKDLPVDFEVIYGSAHGGKAFYDEERMALVDYFLRSRM
ncbi:alpha/beta hydrolase [Opitutia bacterium ISCC 51]|nr:alpha/beta hydrolase [Opitutae bacterium ISCC 51]QXD28599.1 alpha/beta hydrolase [Opitutae bacterium ISCC 52]